jgi:hypothetical protein
VDHDTDASAAALMARFAEIASDDELARLNDLLNRQAQELADQAEAEPTDEALARLNDLGDALDAVRGEQRRREPEPDTTAVVATRLSATRPRSTRPVPSAGGPRGVMRDARGREISHDELLDALAEAVYDASNTRTAHRRRVASLFPAADGAATLGGNPRLNAEIVAAAVGLGALTASGGLCSPPALRWDQPVLASSQRPVRDALVPIPATRGSIMYALPPRFTTTTAGVSVWTVTDDENAALPEGPTKPSLTVDCPQWETVEIEAVTAYLRFGTFASRWFRERVDAYVTALRVDHAALAETQLLTAIDTGSIPVTHGPILSAATDTLTMLDRAASLYRDVERLSPTQPLTVIAPAWLTAMIRADLTRRPPGDATLAPSDAEIAALFAARHLNVVTSLDWQRGTVQGAGPLEGWPATLDLFLFEPRVWGWLDGGELDVGTFRDTSLVATNDVALFFESFEGAAKLLDLPSWKLTLDVCVNGATPAPLDVDPCAGGAGS